MMLGWDNVLLRLSDSNPGVASGRLLESRQDAGPPLAGLGHDFAGVKGPTGGALAASEAIEHATVLVRGQKVMLDSALTSLCGVTTKSLNQAVRRNPERFPPDFMLELTMEEARLLRSQTVTLEPGRGQHRKYSPRAFTDLGE